MNLLNKIGEGYQSLWKLIIRPERNFYSIPDLGPTLFYLGNKKIKRVDQKLINPRGLSFQVSHFIPVDLQKYPCLIYMHGNSSNRLQGTEYLQELINEGISLVTFDFSGCGNAEGDYISLGWYEWEDLAQVVASLLKKPQITTLGLWGRSMGAVTALMYLKQDQMIKAAVFDSPFMSLKTLIQDLCRKNSSIPMFVFSAAMMIISKTIKNKADFDLYKLNPVEQAPKIKTPGFFIGAVDDQLVSTTHIRELFKAYGGKKHLEIVQGDHNSNRPQRCIDEAVKFLKSHLVGKQPQQNKQDRKQEEGFISQDQNQLSLETQKHEMGNDKEIPSPEQQGLLNKLSLENILNGLNPFTFVNSPAPAASLKANTHLSQSPSNQQKPNKQSEKSSPQKTEPLNQREQKSEKEK